MNAAAAPSIQKLTIQGLIDRAQTLTEDPIRECYVIISELATRIAHRERVIDSLIRELDRQDLRDALIEGTPINVQEVGQ